MGLDLYAIRNMLIVIYFKDIAAQIKRIDVRCFIGGMHFQKLIRCCLIGKLPQLLCEMHVYKRDFRSKYRKQVLLCTGFLYSV